jgi:hypothetical protein
MFVSDMENHTRPKRSAMSKVNTLDLIAEALRAHPDCLEVTAIPHAREEDQKIRSRASKPRSCVISQSFWSVADSDPGSGALLSLDPGSGICFFRIPDLGSQIPSPYF